jgi:hypothetical protein
MNMEKLILSLVFVVINIALAFIDARRIKQNKHIYHGVNGAIYGGLILISYLFTHSILSSFAMLLLRIPVFNSSLNLFRGLSIDYTSKSTTSIIDKTTQKIIDAIGYFNYCFVILLIVFSLLCL